LPDISILSAKKNLQLQEHFLGLLLKVFMKFLLYVLVLVVDQPQTLTVHQVQVVVDLDGKIIFQWFRDRLILLL
jgi:hypothetical protein